MEEMPEGDKGDWSFEQNGEEAEIKEEAGAKEASDRQPEEQEHKIPGVVENNLVIDSKPSIKKSSSLKINSSSM